MWSHVRKPFFIISVCLISVIEYSSSYNTTYKIADFYANVTSVNEAHVRNTSIQSILSPVNYTHIAEKATYFANNILDFLNLDEVQEGYSLRVSKLVDLLQELQEKDNNQDPVYRKTLDQQGKNTNPTFSQQNDVEHQDAENAQDTRRIVSGHNTSITQIPWQVSIRDKEFHICGGTIITRTWIITAAHCVVKAKVENLTVRVGSTWKLKGGEIYDIKRIEVHPGYSLKTKSCDVGLLNLHVFLRFSAKILPIKIIPKMTTLKANADAVVSGWGKLSEDGKSANVLQAISLKTIAMKFCIKSGLYRDSIIPETMFCAGSFVPHYSDACQGDSGGPIVSGGVLIGIVSWGLGCARGNFPGVYARLSNPTIRDWVQTHISNEFNPEPHL